MAGLSADRLEQQGATGDGFAMMSRISQTDEQIPPVEHQRDTAGHQAAALEVARREATPTPLVLQFVKTVLAIGAIAIELTERQYLAIERRDENGIFKDLARLVDLGKAEPQLTVTVTFAQRQLALDASSQDHDAAIPAPALKAQAAILALPARTGILPILLAHRPLDRALDPLGQAQLEQIGLMPPLGFAHHRLIAETDIATDQPRPQSGGKPIQQRPQAGGRMLRRMLVARRNFRRQHQASHHIAVIAVRRSPSLVRIVAHHGPFLVTVERLHRGVDIENPRLAQKRASGVIEMS